MAAGAAHLPRPAARKRNRKRKRRNVSSSSSSSDSDSADSSESEAGNAPTTVKLPQSGKRVAAKAPAASSSESSSSSDSESDSDSGAVPVRRRNASGPATATATSRADEPAASTSADQIPKNSAHGPRADSPPPRRNVQPPSFLEGDKEKEPKLKERFRQFWMASIADAFAGDLNEIRKEPNLTPARLSLLIDSLAAGADVYASSRGPDGKHTNEMEVVLGE